MRRLALSLAAGAMLALGLSAPAWATPPGTGVPVAGDVASSVTLCGLTTAVTTTGITFDLNGPVTPGQVAPGKPVIGICISTNDGLGYTFSITPGSPSFGGVPNSAISLTEGALGGHDVLCTTATPPVCPTETFGTANPPVPLAINATNGPTAPGPNGDGDDYSQMWTWNVPTNAVAGHYAETFYYLALGN